MRVHSCMHVCVKISELLSFTRDVCLLIINAHRYLACSDTNPQPSHTHLHTAVLSAMSCQSLLGLAFSLARGLDPLSEELNSGPFPPSAFRRAANKKERRQTGSESQGSLMILESLYLIICWNISRDAWVLQFSQSVTVSKPTATPPLIIVSSSKLQRDHPRVYQRPAVRERNQAYQSTFTLWITVL